MAIGIYRLQGLWAFRTPCTYHHNLKSIIAIDTYADHRKGVQTSSLAFLLDGRRFDGDLTPRMLELEDLDQIDCMLEQTGCWAIRMWFGEKHGVTMVRENLSSIILSSSLDAT